MLHKLAILAVTLAIVAATGTAGAATTLKIWHARPARLAVGKGFKNWASDYRRTRTASSRSTSSGTGKPATKCSWCKISAPASSTAPRSPPSGSGRRG